MKRKRDAALASPNSPAPHAQHRYLIYSLAVTCDTEIPGLAPPTNSVTSPPPDVAIWLAATPPWVDDAREGEHRQWPLIDSQTTPALNRTVWRIEGGAYYRFLYRDATEFIINVFKSEIWGRWGESRTVDDAAMFLLGPILGFLLVLRGIVCLHASALQVGNRVLAIVGPGGIGKSTTAAALSLRGIPVLTEDVTALIEAGDQFLVPPGYPRIRLWDPAVRLLTGSNESLPFLTIHSEKRFLDLTGDTSQFASRPAPLAAIYFLDDSERGSCEPATIKMASGDAFVELVANTYAARLLDAQMRAHEFAVLSKVAATVPMRRLMRSSDPALLGAFCDLILSDFGALIHNSPD